MPNQKLSHCVPLTPKGLLLIHKVSRKRLWIWDFETSMLLLILKGVNEQKKLNSICFHRACRTDRVEVSINISCKCTY